MSSELARPLDLYLSVISLLICLGIVYNILANPLRNLPGPWHTKFTSLGIRATAIRGYQIQWIASLHKRYGPVVRIRPNEVSFSSCQDFKEIHRVTAGFLKSEYYDNQDVTFGAHPSTFDMRDPKRHSARRKLFARVMSARYLYDNWQDRMDSYVRSMVANMKAEAARKPIKEATGRHDQMSENGGEVDVAKWFRLMAGDISSHLMFGESFGNVDKGELVPYMRAIEQLPIMSFLSWTLPVWVLPYLQYLPLPESWRFMYSWNRLVLEHGALAVKNSKADISEDKKNVFATAIAKSEEDDGTLSDAEIVSEAGAFMRAGTDTTAGTLFFLAWAVMQRPHVQRKLEEEVATVDTLDDTQLEKFPILNACIDETMRVYGVASGTLPRQVPPSGATIHDTYLPPGTVIGAPAYVFQRDPEIFPNPEEWNYTHFMSDNPNYKVNKEHLAGFGGGGRICIGKHLATMEMRKAVVHFFRECAGARLSPKVRDVPIEYATMDFFLSPKRTTLEVILPDP